MDTQAFRKALGNFATGVTIVTTRGVEGNPVGVTASSFNSVSLDPPLVLWSLARDSYSHADFTVSESFAVHILASDQDGLSTRFARSGEDKFAGLEVSEGIGGCPLLPEYGALFQCRTVHRYEGGDHVILVGEVVAFEESDLAPLIFYGGRYAEARERPIDPGKEPTSVDLAKGSFTDSFLLYLLARAYYQSTVTVRDACARIGLGEDAYAVLCRLSMANDIVTKDLIAQMDHTGLGIDFRLVDRMIDDGLVYGQDGTLRMTGRGKQYFLEVLSAAKAYEEALLRSFAPGETAEFKLLLRKLVVATGDDVPIAWRD